MAYHQLTPSILRVTDETDETVAVLHPLAAMPRPIRLRLSAGAAVLTVLVFAYASDRCEESGSFSSCGASAPCPSRLFVWPATLRDGQPHRRHVQGICGAAHPCP